MKRMLSVLICCFIVLFTFSAVFAGVENFEISDGVLTAYYGTDAEVIIPDGVTAIGQFVFRYLTQITSVTIPDSVTSIGEYAFFDCSVSATVK